MITKFLDSIALFFRWLLKKNARPKIRYLLQSYEDRRLASAAAQKPNVAAMVCVGNKKKWLLFMCPCGCKQQIALNLMEGHTPRWKVDIQSQGIFTVFPSVDAVSCGAHFWLRDGRVIWAD